MCRAKKPTKNVVCLELTPGPVKTVGELPLNLLQAALRQIALKTGMFLLWGNNV